MLNVKPIFIVGFQRGGTGILMNLLLSHPNVCTPRGETHQVFRGARNLLPVEPLSTYFSKLWIFTHTDFSETMFFLFIYGSHVENWNLLKILV